MSAIKSGVTFARGFQADGISCGLKGNNRPDLALIYSSVPANAAAVYTTNKVKAAPLKINKEHLKNGKAQAIIINSGNANACCSNGLKNAGIMCQSAADFLDIDVDDVLAASTGVIGKELPVEKIVAAIGNFELSDKKSDLANQAIMTTDTVEKTTQIEFMIEDTLCYMGGIAKGSGMIHPNMGTMLCFITTDCDIDQKLLQEALNQTVRKTFNRISVDGDTSTNDMCIVLANGLADNKPISDPDSDSYAQFKKALYQVMETLAIAIAADGEGASRLLRVRVSSASSEEQAEKLARSVASSTLLKAAMFGSDANWGRVICAMGYSGADFDPKKVDIAFSSKQGDILCCKSGLQVDFDEDLAKKILQEDDISISCNIHEGSEEATCWGCDLTYDYVKINGDYRS